MGSPLNVSYAEFFTVVVRSPRGGWGTVTW